MMANLGRSRRTIQILLAVFIAANLAMLLVLFGPWRKTPAQLQAEYEQDRNELQVRMKEILPLRNMDAKIAAATRQSQEFTEARLADRQSAVSQRLGELAKADHVELESVEYEQNDTKLKDLRTLEIQANLQGDYRNLVRLINALERDKMFFIITGVQLNGAKEGNVRLQLRLETYLRTA